MLRGHGLRPQPRLRRCERFVRCDGAAYPHHRRPLHDPSAHPRAVRLALGVSLVEPVAWSDNKPVGVAVDVSHVDPKHESVCESDKCTVRESHEFALVVAEQIADDEPDELAQRKTVGVAISLAVGHAFDETINEPKREPNELSEWAPVGVAKLFSDVVAVCGAIE